MTTLGPAAVYLLCLFTSVGCALLLLKTYMKRRTRLLLWVAVGFGCLAVNNSILVADMVLFPQEDLWIWRQLAAGAGILALIYGCMWEVDS